MSHRQTAGHNHCTVTDKEFFENMSSLIVWERREDIRIAFKVKLWAE